MGLMLVLLLVFPDIVLANCWHSSVLAILQGGFDRGFWFSVLLDFIGCGVYLLTTEHLMWTCVMAFGFLVSATLDVLSLFLF